MKSKKLQIDTIVFITCISLLGAFLRYLLRDDISGDYTAFLEPWYKIFQQNGVAVLSQQVGDYNLPYQTWILGMTWLPLKPLYAYKLVSCLFDYLLAGILGLLAVELKGNSCTVQEDKAALGTLVYGAALLFPQVWIDSAHWAQCDAIYTFWVVFAFYLYIKERWSASFFVLGIALSFKLQAIFVLPFFLLAWFVSHRHSFWKILWMLPGFYLFCIPAILCGRSWMDPLRIYLNQTTEYSAIRFNFPSFWGMVFPAGTHDNWNKVAVLCTLLILAIGMWKLLLLHGNKEEVTDKVQRAAVKKKSSVLEEACLFGEKSNEQWIRLACWSIWTCVLFLPNMHERYAYLLDILMIVLALVFGQLKDIPVIGVCWLCSLVCYGTARLELPYSTDMFRLTCCLYTAAYCAFSRMLFGRTAA